MNVRTLAGFVLLPFLMVTSGTIPAKSDQIDKPSQMVRFVCQSYDRFDFEFRNRVLILDQTSTKTLDNFSGLDKVEGSSLIDLTSRAVYMGATGTAEFRMRIYIATLISDKRTEEEIIEELSKKPGDFRVAKYEFQDSAPMDYVGTGYRDGPNFFFRHAREGTHFEKSFDYNLARYYTTKVFDINDLRDLDHEAVRDLDAQRKFWTFAWMRTSQGSTTLVEDGIYICRKPVLM